MNKFKYILAVLAAIFFVACNGLQMQSGEHASMNTKKINFGTDTCVRCNMKVRSKSYSAEVINPNNNKVYMFDDIGCVVKWFAENKIAWQDEANIFVSDEQTKKLINARDAYFVKGRHTPMHFGFGASKAHQEGAVDFETMQKAILAMHMKKKKMHMKMNMKMKNS